MLSQAHQKQNSMPEAVENKPVNAPARTSLLVGVLFVCFLFVTGWLTGRYGNQAWATIKQSTIDSYLNRYRVMSDSGLDSIVYYVSTKDSTPLHTLAAQSTEILEVTGTKIKDLYDVRINYVSRVATVKALRSLDKIDAVITLPLICH